jgi:hypothetical protein
MTGRLKIIGGDKGAVTPVVEVGLIGGLCDVDVDVEDCRRESDDKTFECE